MDLKQKSLLIYKKRISFVWWLSCCVLAALLASCCQRGPITVYNEYFDERDLASRDVGSPDPLACGYCGQQLIVQWNLSKEIWCQRPSLILRMRFGNQTIEEIPICIKRPWGSFVFCLINRDYWDKQGIATYQVEIRGEDKILYTYSHQVWTKLIDLEEA